MDQMKDSDVVFIWKELNKRAGALNLVLMRVDEVGEFSVCGKKGDSFSDSIFETASMRRLAIFIDGYERGLLSSHSQLVVAANRLCDYFEDHDLPYGSLRAILQDLQRSLNRNVL